MSRKTWMWTISLLVIASMVLAACQAAPTEAPAPEPTTAVEEPVAEPTAAPVEEEPVVEPTATEAPAEPTAEPTEPPAAEMQDLLVNAGAFPDIIDPQKSSFVGEIGHLHLMYEGLSRQNTALETVPAAAESWEYNDDATEITFTLREGLTYSDGTLLNAQRFEYSLMRNSNPATAGEYAAITDDIAGAAEWRTADVTALSEEELTTLQEAVQVRALDSAGNDCTGYDQEDCRTLVIGLKQPAPYFHTVMSLWVTFPAKEEMITEGGDTWWSDAQYHVGNGPFILEEMEPSVRSYFTPNPNYWAGQATYNVEYRYITDGAVAFESYRNGEFDVVGAAAEDLAVIQADPELSQQHALYPGSCTFAFMMHQQKEPFTDPKVREAFARAIDREAWVADVLQGLGSPTLTWIPKGYPGYDDSEDRWGFDPEAAKQALADSTYGSVENLPEITFTFGDTPRNRVRWEWLQQQFAEVLGVQAELNPVESTAFTALTKDIATAPQAFILGWCADYPDPQNWLSVYWKTGAFGERIGYSNPELDAMLNEADATLDEEQRMNMYMEAQKFLLEDVPVAMFWNNVNSYLVSPRVTGYEVTPQDHLFPGDQDPLSITVAPRE